MRALVAGLAMAAGLALTSAPAQAQSALMSTWSVDEMSAVLAGENATVTGQGLSTDGLPYVEATSAEGLPFVVYGTECEGTGPTARCTGAEFTASFTLESDQAVQDALRDIDYAAVSYFNNGDNQLRVTRYVIFDYGIARENLVVNAQVFLSIARRIRDDLPD